MSNLFPGTTTKPNKHRIFPADASTIRWNFPLFADYSSYRDSLITSPGVDRDTRARNTARASLFEVLVDQITLRLDDRPVYVEFSGGCDSSLVLAAAVSACQRQAHDLPVPLTFRYPSLPETNEDSYQDAVLQHLRLNPGHRLTISDEFDLVGPTAQRALRELGLVWPAPAVVTTDVYRNLPAGLVLTGEGGDEVMGPRRVAGLFRARDAALRGEARGVVGNLAYSLGPNKVREHMMFASGGILCPWIGEGEARRYRNETRRVLCSEPLRPSRFAHSYLARPNVWLALHQLTAIAAWAGQSYAAPLMDPAFIHAVDDLTPPEQLRNRYRVMRRHFGELLPKQVVERTDKRSMQSAYFNEHAREFARRWDGRIEDDAIDVEQLKRHWTESAPDHVWGQTFLLLQKAWLLSEGG